LNGQRNALVVGATGIVGFAVGALMNICRETGRPFAFTGVQEQWDMLTEISDARLVARQAASRLPQETERRAT